MRGGEILKIDRIYIGDFGIFRNSIMDNMGNEVILIGGHNRAGKSTFMEVLRNIAWGFPKGGVLPPPNVEYSIESDIISDDGERFNLKIQGYGDPRLYSVSGASNINISDVYNIDKYSYRELYTISLDELNNVSVSDSKLQAVLLGAGFKEAAYLPMIMKDFSREAERIGGRRGNPSTKMFKAFSSTISDAVKDREKALKESKAYTEKENILKENIEEMQKIRNIVETSENNIIILDILKENYSDIRRYRELENILDDKAFALCMNYDRGNLIEARKLKERYTTALKEYDENCSIFSLTVNSGLSFKERLLENKNIILELNSEISGFRERLRAYNINKSNFEEDKKNIIVDIHRINENLNGGFKEIMDIKCDDIEKGGLSKLEINLREADRSIDEWSNKKFGLISQMKIYEDTGADIVVRKNGSLNSINIILISLLLINAIALFYSTMHNFNLGIYFIILSVLLAVTGGYLFYMYKSKSSTIMSKMNIEEQIFRLKGELEASESSLKCAQSKKDETLQKIEYYCRVLKLDENTSPLSIKDYLISVQNIKNRIIKLGIEKKNIDEVESRLNDYIENALDLFKRLGKNEGFKKYDIENYNVYIGEIEKIVSWLPIVSTLEDCSQKLVSVKQSIKKLLGENCDSSIEETLEKYIDSCMNAEKIISCKFEYDTLKKSIGQVLQSERVRAALSNCMAERGIEESLVKLLHVFSNYISYEEIDQQYEKLKYDKETLKREIEELTDKIQKLKSEIKDILISDKIRNAQETIDIARGGMRPLAEKYAVNAAASFILNKVYKNFMDKTQSSLLKGSSEILEIITGGEYVNILPPKEVQSVDFRAALKDGLINESSNILSRATKEQLFLSVRLNRIKQNECKLPVIIDDSFVNFDAMHIKHTLEIISELSKTNQVFILTCHPYMVEYASTLSKETQYWKLANGQFSSLDRDSLKNYLAFH